MGLYNEQMKAYEMRMLEYETLLRQYELEPKAFEKQVFGLVPGVVLQRFRQELDSLTADAQARKLTASVRDFKINEPEGFIMLVSNLSVSAISSRLRAILDEGRGSRAIELDDEGMAKLRQAIERISPALHRLVAHHFDR